MQPPYHVRTLEIYWFSWGSHLYIFHLNDTITSFGSSLFIYVLMLVFIWFFSFSSFLRSLTHRVVQLLSRQIALTFMSWHIWWFTTYSINCSISLIFTANFRSRTCEPSHPHSTMDCLLEVQVLQSFNWQNFLNYSWIMPSQNQPTATNDHLWKIYRCSLIKFNKFCNLH